MSLMSSTASGVAALAAGNNALASANLATALGPDAVSSGDASVAIGEDANATATDAVAIAKNSLADRQGVVATGCGDYSGSNAGVGVNQRETKVCGADGVSTGAITCSYTPPDESIVALHAICNVWDVAAGQAMVFEVPLGSYKRTGGNTSVLTVTAGTTIHDGSAGAITAAVTLTTPTVNFVVTPNPGRAAFDETRMTVEWSVTILSIA
jgi:trimeric autotransporter adhesin